MLPSPRPNINNKKPIKNPKTKPAIGSHPFFFQTKYISVIIHNNQGVIPNIIIAKFDDNGKNSIIMRGNIKPDQLYIAPKKSDRTNNKILFILIFNFTNDIRECLFNRTPCVRYLLTDYLCS